ncbi:OLC1v1022969C1 [Oldenlandia corymbosa var. corymbosa]|uniref:OLC1v1022969C1 n=1 Tax=Oldenlandia corymbosa var. corymbosa TaxID=529605 RepID=A0AAV1C0D4_OLDCO|nr:OLC1v1022969C1 [Oldenlandia corymbosa var. corymbosa]
MAKNRNKKRKSENGSAAMDLTSDYTVVSAPEAMDTSEVAVRKSAVGLHGKKKGVQMKRAKNVRKMKAVAKALSKMEQEEEKMSKIENKMLRIKSAKKLYD